MFCGAGVSVGWKNSLDGRPAPGSASRRSSARFWKRTVPSSRSVGLVGSSKRRMSSRTTRTSAASCLKSGGRTSAKSGCFPTESSTAPRRQSAIFFRFATPASALSPFADSSPRVRPRRNSRAAFDRGRHRVRQRDRLPARPRLTCWRACFAARATPNVCRSSLWVQPCAQRNRVFSIVHSSQRILRLGEHCKRFHTQLATTRVRRRTR